VHYILCKEDSWTKTLVKEILADFTKDCTVVKDFPVITIPKDVDLREGYLAFSNTALINATEIAEDTVSKQVNNIIESILPKINANGKINTQVFALTEKHGIIESGRAEIVKSKITAALKKKNIYCFRKGFDRLIPLLQVLILADRSIAVSYLNQEEMELYRSLVSPFAGGMKKIEDDKKAPSRAYRKLIEAQLVMGRTISEGELVVDLGACPGGWTYVARNNGARVIALDRSPLTDELMQDELVHFIKADAFKYKPEEEIDWVVSDIISAPERILELMDYWVLEKKCKNFVFTIKFQGDKDYGVLQKFKKVAKQCEFKVILKQLNANKNEVTIMGSREG
jgi:23S rRNA (cytidine2498-2'-O)-methyltransferase